MLAELFGSRVRARVLGWLLSHPDERYFVRQVSTLLGEDATNVSRELARLEGMSILTVHPEGRQKYYQANRRCPFFNELRGLVLKTVGMAGIVREALAPLGDDVVAAFIYGSQAADGGARVTSDIDLLVIGNVKFTRIVAALGPYQEALGREVNPAVYPLAEVKSKLAKGNHFLKTVFAGPKIFLIGGDNDLARLVGAALDPPS